MERQELRWIAVEELLKQAPFPPRETNSPIEVLRNSVRLEGVIVPLLVRETEEGLQVVSGYRRLLAARDSDIKEVPAVVAHIGDAESIRCYFYDNDLRRELDQNDRSLARDRLEELKRSGDDDSGAGDYEMGSRITEQLGSRIATPETSDRSEAIADLIVRTEDLFEVIKADRRFDPEIPRGIVSDLLTMAGDDVLRRDEIYAGDATNWLPRHSLWVASVNAAMTPGGFSGLGRDGYAIAGLLHDIGMLLVDENLTVGEAELSADERRRLHAHPRLGHAVIASIGKEWAEIALAARDHHERLDGSGYPGGLRSSEIGRLARVTALTDSLLSLLGPRPFREPESLGAARGKLALETEAGSYDSTLYPLLHATTEGIDQPTTGVSADAISKSSRLSRTPAMDFH